MGNRGLQGISHLSEFALLILTSNRTLVTGQAALIYLSRKEVSLASRRIDGFVSYPNVSIEMMSDITTYLL